MDVDIRRRRMMAILPLAALSATATAALLDPTPRQSAGPFYPPEPPLDDDNDLTRISGREGVALGQISDLSGRLLDTNGNAIQGTRIEIWQCDANGRYLHPHDRGGRDRDPGFQGFGKVTTDDEGRYRFRTILPVPYPGRAPHIHMAVFPDGERPFTTQIYVAGDSHNAADFLYRRLTPEQQDLVTANFERSNAGTVEYRASIDVVLGAVPLA